MGEKCLRTEPEGFLHSSCFYREKLNLCKIHVLATEEQVELLSGVFFQLYQTKLLEDAIPRTFYLADCISYFYIKKKTLLSACFMVQI